MILYAKLYFSNMLILKQVCGALSAMTLHWWPLKTTFKNVIWPNFCSPKNIFWTKDFYRTQIFLDQKFLLDQTFLSNLHFMVPKLRDLETYRLRELEARDKAIPSWTLSTWFKLGPSWTIRCQVFSFW